MSFINWELGVADKEIWWDTVKKHNGWKLQQHKLTQHYRIISPDKKRKAWGVDYDELLMEFNSLAGVERIPSSLSIDNTARKKEIYDELDRIAELVEKGAISMQEHKELKADLMHELKTIRR